MQTSQTSKRKPPSQHKWTQILTVFTFLHNRLETLTFYPFEQLINIPAASVVGDVVLNLVHSLSSLSVSLLTLPLLFLSSHTVHFFVFLHTPSCLFPLALSGGGGLLQTAVGGQNLSRQQEGEESLSGALKGQLAGSSSSFLFLYLAHVLSCKSHSISVLSWFKWDQGLVLSATVLNLVLPEIVQYVCFIHIYS